MGKQGRLLSPSHCPLLSLLSPRRFLAGTSCMEVWGRNLGLGDPTALTQSLPCPQSREMPSEVLTQSLTTDS